MAQTGRNDFCPCGSGNKYKRCCLEKDEAAASASLATERQQHAARELQAHDEAVCSCCGERPLAAGHVAAEDAVELDEMSNTAVDLVHEGKLDEAERLARQLLERFPDVHDGYDRLAMVYQARGDNKQAASYYRKVIDLVREHQDAYDPKFTDSFRELADRLDPPTPA